MLFIINHRTKSQAMLELAIFGVLFLTILGMLVEYGVRFNAQQEMVMKSFRSALRKASSDNIGDAYLTYSAYHQSDLPIASVSSPYGISNLGEIGTSSGARRSYYMMQAEKPDEKNTARMHYIFNGRERKDYDSTAPADVDGFKIEGLAKDVAFKKDSNGNFRVIRTISDPEDLLEPKDVFWTWIDIRINKLTVPLSDDGNVTNFNTSSEEKIIDIYDNAEITGEIFNLGIDLKNPLVGDKLGKEDFFDEALEYHIVDQGTTLHSSSDLSCLKDIDTPYKISLVKVYHDKNSGETSADIKSSAWGEINFEELADPLTAKVYGTQGLTSYKRTETWIDEAKLTNKKTDNKFNTNTEIKYKDKIKRKLILNSGKELDIDTIRDIDYGKKYNWDVNYE